MIKRNMMPRRTGESRDCPLNLPVKNFRRKLGVFNELARKRDITPIDSLGRRKTGVVLGSCPEPKHHQR